MIKEMKWQPIETAPKDGTPILTYTSNCSEQEQCLVAWWDVTRAEFRSNGWTAYELTHYISPDLWMPLPPPPSAEEGQ